MYSLSGANVILNGCYIYLTLDNYVQNISWLEAQNHNLPPLHKLKCYK